MVWIIVLIGLGILIYLKVKSKSNFFTMSEADLSIARFDLINVLRLAGRSEWTIEEHLKAFDYFIKHPTRFDGATVARDLFMLKYNFNGIEYKYTPSAGLHDFEYIVLGANRSYLKNWKSNYKYFKDLERNGKGLHISRLFALSLLSIFYVPYNQFKYKMWCDFIASLFYIGSFGFLIYAIALMYALQ